jgi:hypothetical protein
VEKIDQTSDYVCKFYEKCSVTFTKGFNMWTTYTDWYETGWDRRTETESSLTFTTALSSNGPGLAVKVLAFTGFIVTIYGAAKHFTK